MPAPTDRLSLARAMYGAVPLYNPDSSPVEIDLTDNTNLWGMPPTAQRVLREIPASGASRYPSLYASEFKREIGRYLGVNPEQVVTGSGSDDIIDCALRAFGEPGDLVAGSEPSFAMVPIFSRINSLAWNGVVELPSHQPDIDRLIASNPRILFLCSPNNPTGALMARATIERAVHETTGAVFIDEAYAEFAGVTAVDLVARSNRVLVIRTMSKAFGLAGLRIGYGIGQPELVNEVEKSRGPFKVNAFAEQAAVAALRHDIGWMQEHAALAVETRERLAVALRRFGLEPLPSHANFLLVPVANITRVATALRASGVAVRAFPNLPSVGDSMRVSVGPWPMMERLLHALEPALRSSESSSGGDTP